MVFGRYDALSVAEAIKDACPEAAPSIDAARDVLHDAPELLKVSCGKCWKAPVPRWVSGSHSCWSSTTSNVFWMSHSWVAVSGGCRPPITPCCVPCCAPLRWRTDSRLLLTSRYLFTLPDGDRDLADRLYSLQLPPMDGASARKQVLRAETKGACAYARAHSAATPGLLTRCVEVAQGIQGCRTS